MQEKLRESVTNDFEGFELYYQPIVNIKRHKILGAEALLRWKNEAFGSVSPGEFIPLLEESGLIIPVGRWIIKTAMNQCLEWQKVDAEFRININLSFIQIKKSNIIQDIDICMKELNFQSRNVLFEVTESGELEEGYMTKKILQSFQRRKLNLAIDDFGTGYSNLRYIKEMMFDLVKIDQEFIRNITESQYDFLVVKQFTELAHSLNLKVCYEGVETYEDLQCVLKLDPDYIQGFYFARPVPADEFEKSYLGRELEF
jgi:EAL domain-containing protein (putative c-di-GMP-specific phosphodiesterase class I)